MTTGMGMLATGNAKAIIAGGVELLSDVPIRYNRKARKAMLSMQKAKALGDKVKLGTEIVKNMFSPELPAVAEYSSGETMGHSGDRLAAAFNVSRRLVNLILFVNSAQFFFRVLLDMLSHFLKKLSSSHCKY
ncbi:unnamed protein product [Cylicostephanus goldi]|uniref:Thiolase N-terminal domain-containing protein n=1 Tax=Cylicostephanus goldi TaxID=71465 RepID=A0A3P7MPP1_CYLGO|nr:unnamed protein product [Cylicostephanus goldi]